MGREPWILGISNNMHNGSACIIRGGELVVAIQEERLTRIKRARIDFNDSFLCVMYCLRMAGITPSDLSLVAECSAEGGHRGAYQGSRLQHYLGEIPHLLVSHHLAHAASCGGPSGFDQATVLVIDGGGSPANELSESEASAIASPFLGECAYEHISTYYYDKGKLEPVEKLVSPMPYLSELGSYNGKAMAPFRSLGHMFSSVALLSFLDYLDAGKVMGLAPYGEPIFPPDEWFDYKDGVFTFLDHVPNKFVGFRPWPARESELADLAASVQKALENGLERMMGRIGMLGLPGEVAYAGGVALNSVANHRVIARSCSELFILPAAEDSGTAVGAAYYGLSQLEPATRPHRFESDSVGGQHPKSCLDSALEEFPGIEEVMLEDPFRHVAELLASGHILGWFSGRSELGPRALGNRSILCDPRGGDAKKILNSRVKFRESFRPFAPILLNEHVPNWFELTKPSRAMEYMLEICKFQERVEYSSIVHVDGTGRLQALKQEANPELYAVLCEFHRLTEVPILINTSFNVMGEPIVESPRDALWDLLFTDIDDVYIEGRIFTKSAEFRGVESLVPEMIAAIVSNEGKSELICETSEGAHRYNVSDRPLAVAILKVIDGTRSVGDLLECSTVQDLTISGGDNALLEFGWLVRIRAVSFRFRSP